MVKGVVLKTNVSACIRLGGSNPSHSATLLAVLPFLSAKQCALLSCINLQRELVKLNPDRSANPVTMCYN